MADGGITAAIALTGVGLSIFGGAQQADAQKKQAKASKRAESVRQSQAAFEAQQARRNAARRGQIARANATSAAVSQGVDLGSSSVIGGQASIRSDVARQTRAINIGSGNRDAIFSANKTIATQGGRASTGRAIAGVGNSFVSNSGQIGRVGTFAVSRFS